MDDLDLLAIKMQHANSILRLTVLRRYVPYYWAYIYR